MENVDCRCGSMPRPMADLGPGGGRPSNPWDPYNMARNKTGISRERVYGKSKRTEQAACTSDTSGGRKLQTASYRKEKQKTIKKEVARARSPKEMVYRTRHYRSTSGTYWGATSESSEFREKGPSNEENRSTTAECPVPESSSGATGGNVEEREDDPFAPLPGGPIDRSLLKSFKNHIAAKVLGPPRFETTPFDSDLSTVQQGEGSTARRYHLRIPK
ncbi:hypothetical protein Scep_029336 [Stephania cephalantha]|uniref:Uncharacterized protein n=1 Tax=Stephania cephalantha TaxID=152367 RepID=A0AAP0E0F8_9MAGN